METMPCDKYHRREPKVVVSEGHNNRWTLRQEVKEAFPGEAPLKGK